MCEESDIIALHMVMSIMGALGLRWSVVEARYLIRGEMIWMEDSRSCSSVGCPKWIFEMCCFGMASLWSVDGTWKHA